MSAYRFAADVLEEVARLIVRVLQAGSTGPARIR